MPSISSLIRPNIAALEAYTPIVPLDVLAERLGLPIERLVKLDANENPYGPSPQALAALAHEPYYAIYPDPEQARLRNALSAYTGQPAERIVCGAGADEIIDLLLRLLIEPGDAVINCPPTFGMYAFDTGVCGGRVVTVPRQADFSLDLAGIERAAAESGAKVLFLTSPNNPTGNLTSRADIERLLELPLLVVVDEAYIEFADSNDADHLPSLVSVKVHRDAPIPVPPAKPESASVADLVGRYENLAVLRTFSKWAGLAGLRIGYGLVYEDIAAQLWKIKQPYNVNLAAQRAAEASLEDLAYLRGNVARLVVARERLYAALCKLPFLQPYPSAANFILCRVMESAGDTDRAWQIKQALERQGILIRYYNTPLLRDCIRISVGTREQNETVVQALHQMTQENS